MTIKSTLPFVLIYGNFLESLLTRYKPEVMGLISLLIYAIINAAITT